ncbi:hypothetical protein O0L34_g9641 [Tuta absoluta]|nr:hypothetical protein O0L34_g9641 [Tuta absoluta]
MSMALLTEARMFCGPVRTNSSTCGAPPPPPPATHAVRYSNSMSMALLTEARMFCGPVRTNSSTCGAPPPPPPRYSRGEVLELHEYGVVDGGEDVLRAGAHKQLHVRRAPPPPPPLLTR